MKIAVATIDGKSISQHFGQSMGFIIYELEGTEIRNRELRSIAQTPHDQGLCGSGEGSGPAGQNRSSVPELLRDCKMVLCGGMGAGAAQALGRLGIEPLIVATSSADDAVADYLRGTLSRSSTPLCQCQH
jgi:predicted Fe-Mo cluster-binding NifX family protein